MGSTQSTWGESSAPRRPTHDTNTSRREVKITYTRQQHVIKAKQIQIHHEVYYIDCIYFDASCCSYGFNSFCKVHCISRTSKILLQCCRANTLECQACIADVSEEEFCRRKPHSHVCPKKPTKPSHPHNCYSKDLKKEVMHG